MFKRLITTFDKWLLTARDGSVFVCDFLFVCILYTRCVFAHQCICVLSASVFVYFSKQRVVGTHPECQLRWTRPRCQTNLGATTQIVTEQLEIKSCWQNNFNWTMFNIHTLLVIERKCVTISKSKNSSNIQFIQVPIPCLWIHMALFENAPKCFLIAHVNGVSWIQRVWGQGPLHVVWGLWIWKG